MSDTEGIACAKGFGVLSPIKGITSSKGFFCSFIAVSL